MGLNSHSGRGAPLQMTSAVTWTYCCSLPLSIIHPGFFAQSVLGHFFCFKGDLIIVFLLSERLKCWACTPHLLCQLKGQPPAPAVPALFTKAAVCSSAFYMGWIRCCHQSCSVSVFWRRVSHGQWKDNKLNSFAGSLWMPRNICLYHGIFSKYNFKLVLVLSAVKRAFTGVGSLLWRLSKAELLLVCSSQQSLNQWTVSFSKCCFAK